MRLGSKKFVFKAKAGHCTVKADGCSFEILRWSKDAASHAMSVMGAACLTDIVFEAPESFKGAAIAMFAAASLGSDYDKSVTIAEELSGEHFPEIMHESILREAING